MRLIRRLVAACLAAVPWTAPRADAAGAPLVLAKTGYLFAGGKIDSAAEGSPMVGHLYAEFMIPQKQLHPYPIVMIHGGSQTGTNFTGTADGREGWAQYFVRRGYAVYVVDQVARGRAAYWAPLAYGPVTKSRLDFVEQRFVRPEEFKKWPQAHLHTQWPGSGKPGDPFFDAFYATQFPSVVDFAKQQEINRDAMVALLDKIGPAIVLTHSQSGSFGWPIADRRPKLVKAILAVEPSGPPVHDIDFLGSPDWFKDNDKTKISGLGEIPITYDPPLKDGDKLSFVREDQPGSADLVRCWKQADPPRKLPNLKDIPVLILTSEASYHASYDHCTAGYLTQAGVQNTFIRLPDVGVKGNGHMMMIEKNSDAIAAVMEGWLKKTFAGKHARR